MLFNRPCRTAVISSLVVIAAGSAGAWPHKHGEKARVHFLAASTLIRSSWGPNEDTYLAQLVLPRQNEAVLVRLVDTYPNEWPPIPSAALKSDSGAVLFVNRDSECDRAFGEILLRAAPGDPIAILGEPLVYRPALEHTPAQETIMPCYRVSRR